MYFFINLVFVVFSKPYNSEKLDKKGNLRKKVHVVEIKLWGHILDSLSRNGIKNTTLLSIL